MRLGWCRKMGPNVLCHRCFGRPRQTTCKPRNDGSWPLRLWGDGDAQPRGPTLKGILQVAVEIAHSARSPVLLSERRSQKPIMELGGFAANLGEDQVKETQ